MLHKIESESQIGKHIGALLLNDIKETMMAEVSWRTGKIKYASWTTLDHMLKWFLASRIMCCCVAIAIWRREVEQRKTHFWLLNVIGGQLLLLGRSLMNMACHFATKT